MELFHDVVEWCVKYNLNREKERHLMETEKGVAETKQKKNHIVNFPLMGIRLWTIINFANLSRNRMNVSFDSFQISMEENEWKLEIN